MNFPKIEERTLYEPLIGHLREIGFEAFGETKVIQVHPDIIFKIDSISFVIEVKIGEPKIGLKAVAQASDYANKLGTNNIIILIYPNLIRNQMVLSSEMLDNIVLHDKVHGLILTDYLTKFIVSDTINIFDLLKSAIISRKRNIEFSTVIKLIENYVKDLNFLVCQTSTEELASEVVNKLELFCSIGEIKNKNTAKNQITNLASYLLFNQLLFYHIYRKKSNDPLLEELKEVKDFDGIQIYFDNITEIDFQPIYRINILSNIPKKDSILKILNDVIKSIKLLRAEHIKHDLFGRLFHDLIPSEIRKVLAAFYTHPISSELLSNMTIEHFNETILDPACGSGTLLVSSYNRKKDLYKKIFGHKNFDNIHRKFVEEEITGIDIMPFAAHISALNLITQNIQQKTNNIRIAAKDSLSLSESLVKLPLEKRIITIEPYTKQIQLNLDLNKSHEDFFSLEQRKLRNNEGALSPTGKGKGYNLKPVDVIIMNPPFSDREKMPKFMREKLKKNYVLNRICGNKVNLWGYFLALADLLIKKEGKIGAVLPINIARGVATQKIRKFILNQYKIRYLIKTLKDIAFSEGCKFKDILLIAEKSTPNESDLTGIVFLKKSIKNMDIDKVHKCAENIKKIAKKDIIYESDDFDILFKSHKELSEFKYNLMPLIGLSEIKNVQMLTDFIKIINKRNLEKIFNLSNFRIREGFHTSPAGLSQLTFVTRRISKERTSRAFLILCKEKENSILVRLKNTPLTFNIPISYTFPALRSLTNFSNFYINKKKDYFIKKSFKEFNKIIGFSKWNKNVKFNWEKISIECLNAGSYLYVARRFRPNSKNTHFFAFYSDFKFVASDAFKIIQADKKESKIQSLLLNSVVTLVNIILYKGQTTEGYADIRGSDLSLFNTINSQKLTNHELDLLNTLFEKIKSVDFPCILEQLKEKFWARVELDITILKILKFSNKEINEILPTIYSILIKELESV